MTSPTKEQTQIINAAKGSDNILLITAFAGSGKTTTLQMIANALPNKKGLYLAYNRAILQDAKSRFPSNITCKTTHGLAYEYYAAQYRKKITNKLTARKVVRHLDIENMSMQENNVLVSASNINIAACAMRIVNNFCYSADQEVTYEHFSNYFLELLYNRYRKKVELEYDKKNFNTPKTFLEYYANYCTHIAIELWEAMIDQDSRVGITHDAYLKLYQLSKRRIKNIDFILIDESQDANPAVLDILNNQEARRIYVGDQYQQIYKWRGSVNAMNEIDGDKLYLTQSFRFGQKIADEGNKILSMLGEKQEIKPNLSIDSKVEKIDEGTQHTIICRTNFSILKKCIECYNLGRKVACIGGLKGTLKDFESGYYLWKGKIEKVKSPKVLLYQSWENLLEEAELTGDPEIRGIVNFIEEYEENTISAINNILSVVIHEENNADIILSTAHKAKGLEWPRVKIAGDFREPAKCSPDELNLWYVSVTRAIEVLDLTEVEKLFTTKEKKFLSIELVPSTAWFSNVRSIVTEHEWSRIKRAVYRRAGRRCEICNGYGSKWPVECHEIWDYDDDKKLQTLKGLIALCPSCHEVKHIGYASIRGRAEMARAHLCSVNNWSQEKAISYIEEQFRKWEERSMYEWHLDISFLKDEFGIDVQVHERKKDCIYF